MNLTLDPTEAPDGYYAVLKSSVLTADLGNICRACDWRPQCQKSETDFSLHNHRCMSYPIISFKTGREILRNDGCSVVFKRFLSNASFSQVPSGSSADVMREIELHECCDTVV